MFQFAGRAGETIVAEVTARRLDSPLDSVLKLTDAAGKLLAFNDDHEDPESGLNTHHADSYLMVKLPADGTYYVHLGDTARNGGEEYAYRLRISAAARFRVAVVPSSIAMRGKSGRGERLRHPQGRVHRRHQAGPEGPAGGIQGLGRQALGNRHLGIADAQIMSCSFFSSGAMPLAPSFMNTGISDSRLAPAENTSSGDQITRPGNRPRRSRAPSTGDRSRSG